MNKWLASGSAVILLSFLLMIISAVRGDLDVYLILIIPVFIFRGFLGIISIIAFFIGIILLIVGISSKRIREGSSGSVNGIVFIGPFPIVFGSKGSSSRSPRWRYLFLIGMALFILINFLFLLLSVVI